MGDVTLRWTGEGLTFRSQATYGAPILTGNDPDGPGSKPSDLLPISLAACTVYDVVVILRKQRQDLRALEVRISSEQDTDPPWPTNPNQQPPRRPCDRALGVEVLFGGRDHPSRGASQPLARGRAGLIAAFRALL